MDLSHKIDIAENISPQNFNRYYFKPQKPLLIKGLASDKAAGSKWSLNYFKDLLGHVTVDVYDNGNKKSAGSAFTKPDLKMKLGDYLDILLKNEHSDLRIFLFDLFKYHPDLKKEFPCPDFFNYPFGNMARMFFGSKDTSVRIHYDIDMSNVLHTHFCGKKRVILFSPEYSSLLYRLPFNTYSLIDPLKPDHKKYPALKYLKGYDLILEPGDSVFIPCGYWHHMTYLEGSFSVSYRRIGPGIYPPLRGLVNLGLHLPFDKLLNTILSEQWLGTKERIAEKRINKFIRKKRKHQEIMRLNEPVADF